MLDQVESFFLERDFEVQRTDLNYLASKHAGLAEAQRVGLASSEAFGVLKYHPEFFVWHKGSKPPHGIFYVVVASEGVLSEERSLCLVEYFPDEILLVSRSADGDFVGRWPWHAGSFVSLESLVEQLISKQGS